ncbi:MAG: hypothetical protein K2M34_02200 [Alphaproteobacteria bacterium]|nr:hypothetical protein [Alphaproteobacteria bacterium]
MHKKILTASKIANIVLGGNIKPIIPDVPDIHLIIAEKEMADKIRETIAKITHKDNFFAKHR